MGCSPPASSVHGILQSRILEWVFQYSQIPLLQGIFSTQGLNLGLLHCRQMLYCVSHQGSAPFDEIKWKGMKNVSNFMMTTIIVERRYSIIALSTYYLLCLKKMIQWLVERQNIKLSAY